MECIKCHNSYDFTNAFKISCGCCYCVKCIVKNIYDVVLVSGSTLKSSIKCCDIVDSNFIFGLGSIVEIEYRKHIINFLNK